jgi:two-component system sensor histidine kinase DesK
MSGIFRAPRRPRTVGGVAERDPGEFSSRAWPDWSRWPDGKLGSNPFASGRLLGVGFASLWLLFLIQPIREIATGGYSPLFADTLLAATACYGASYPLAMWFGPRCRPRGRVAIVAVMFALGLVPVLMLRSPDLMTDLIYAICIGLMLLPLRYSRLLGLATAVSQILWMWLGYGHVNWGEVATLVGVTAAVGAFFALMFTVGHLRAAREQVRTLAVAEERERVARDLHDILGHSLSTIAVKAGLARRILESSADIEQAIAEIRGLEELSRQAHGDVRATVSDYRTVTLSAELAGARAALQAAGVAAELPAAVDDVAPELQGVFGYVVREAVTNVLRHSEAKRCRIRLARHWVEIADDGTATPESAGGHGLAGLAERLAAVSGSLEHGARAGGGFRVLARGPAPVELTKPEPVPHAETSPA